MSQQNTGAAPSLGSSTGDPALATGDASASAAPAVAAAPDVSTAPVVTATGTTMEPGKVKFTVEQGMSVGKQFVLGDAEMLVGREDTEEDIYPDIDLSDQDEGFVHRRHAQLNFANGQLTVTHLGGANKTRINNRPLPDNEAQPVNIGDKVAFGKVVMRVGAN
jgi:pSer/pThr/pTyr-binding forkhead associated (FHA) protein